MKTNFYCSQQKMLGASANEGSYPGGDLAVWGAYTANELIHIPDVSIFVPAI